GSQELSLSWADIADPSSLVLEDTPVITELQDKLKDLLKSGTEQLDSISSLIGSIPGFNQKIPVIDKSVAELLPVSTILELGQAAADYLNDPNPATTGELPTMRGLIDALAAKLKAALGNSAQGGTAAGPFSISGGYFADTNELRFDIVVDAGYEQSFTLEGSSFGVDAAAIGLDFQTELDVDAALTAAFSIGLDLSKLDDPAEAFFVRVTDPLAASVSVSGSDLNLGITLGDIAEVAIDGGVFDLSALLELELQDPNGDGRVTVSELTSTPFSELFVLSAEASLEAELPLSGTFGGFDVTKFGTPTILISA